LVTLVCTGYPTRTKHQIQMPHICTGWSLTPVQMCFAPRQSISLLSSFFLFFSFLFLISLSSHLIQSRFKVTKFTSILISNHKIYTNKSPIRNSMHLAIIYHINLQFLHITISQDHRRTKRITHKCISKTKNNPHQRRRRLRSGP
jgi:hypothetical protein